MKPLVDLKFDYKILNNSRKAHFTHLPFETVYLRHQARSNEWTTLQPNIGKLLCLLLNFQKSLLDPYMCLEARDLKVLGFDTLSKKEERSTTKNNHAKI